MVQQKRKYVETCKIFTCTICGYKKRVALDYPTWVGGRFHKSFGECRECTSHRKLGYAMVQWT